MQAAHLCDARMLGCTIDFPEVTLFDFPEVAWKNKLWAEFVGVEADDKPYRGYLCAKHFHRSQFQNDSCQTLLLSALPSIPTNPSDESSYPRRRTSVSEETLHVPLPCPRTEAVLPQDYLVDSPSYDRGYSEVDPVPSTSGLSYASGFSSVPTAAIEPSNVSGDSSHFVQTSTTPLLGSVGAKSARQLSSKKKSLSVRYKALEKKYRREKAKSAEYSLILKLAESQAPSGSVSSPLVFDGSSLSQLNTLLKYHRRSNDVKVIAMSMYKYSPKDYPIFRSVFPLPTERTLIKLLHSVPFTPGINYRIFDALSNSLRSRDSLNRTCCLMFNEMSIKQHVQYDTHSDLILGYEDLGSQGRSNTYADRALVFMIKGLRSQFKLPVAYYFISGGIEANVLLRVIMEVLGACKNAGLDIVTTICDMALNNVKAFKLMGAHMDRPWFQFEGKEVVCLFNPPHLLKSTRNMLFKYDVLTPLEICGGTTGRARWEHIVDAIERDRKNKKFQLFKKLTDDHLNPVGIKATRVRLAAQILSDRVSSRLYQLGSLAMLPEVLPTAMVTGFMSQLYDSLNGQKLTPIYENDLRFAIQLSRENSHLQFWENAIETLKQWKFISKDEIEVSGNVRVVRPLSQYGWIATLNGVKHLWKMLKEKGFTLLSTRLLNQDPLEHLFQSLRSNCGKDTNPTVQQFKGTLMTCIFHGLSFRDIKDSNVKKPCFSEEILNNLTEFLNLRESTVSPQQASDSAVLEFSSTSFEKRDITEKMSLAYVTGCIVRTLLKHCKCIDCRGCLVLNEPDHGLYDAGICFREYSDGKGGVMYPTQNMVLTVGASVTLLERLLPNIYHESSISHRCISALKSSIDTVWIGQTCPVHDGSLRDQIFCLVFDVCIHWWVKRINRQIKVKSSA